jgi:hypothetical protein
MRGVEIVPPIVSFTCFCLFTFWKNNKVKVALNAKPTLIDVPTIVCNLLDDVLVETKKITLEVIKLLQEDYLAHNDFSR